jgi:hypothetical protein
MSKEGQVLGGWCKDGFGHERHGLNGMRSRRKRSSTASHDSPTVSVDRYNGTIYLTMHNGTTNTHTNSSSYDLTSPFPLPPSYLHTPFHFRLLLYTLHQQPVHLQSPHTICFIYKTNVTNTKRILHRHATLCLSIKNESESRVYLACASIPGRVLFLSHQQLPHSTI